MVSCNEYDYIELVCLYRYPIKLTLKTGEIIDCTALDTQYDAARKECIKVSIEGVESYIVLNEISKLEVSIDNPHFKQVVFNE